MRSTHALVEGQWVVLVDGSIHRVEAIYDDMQSGGTLKVSDIKDAIPVALVQKGIT